MIHSAALRLTLAYLAIVMSLSIGFSVIVYRLSGAEINRGLRRPPLIFQLANPDLDYDQFRREQVSESTLHIRNTLILFNLATLVAGGALSYALARRTMEPIEEALEAQTRFTADASHELRTPLTAMQTEIEVALRQPKLPKAAAVALLRSNLEEVGKLRTLSDGLLRLARQDKKTALIRKRTDIQDVAMQAISRAQPQATLKQITIQNSVAPGKLMTDAESLIEIITILLSNAVKYSGGGTTVSLGTRRHERRFEIVVADQGQGINATDLPHIFERFYRADNSRTNSSTEGYGLGLAIAKELATMLGGDIAVTSEVDKGSTFRIRLPVSTTKQPKKTD